MKRKRNPARKSSIFQRAAAKLSLLTALGCGQTPIPLYPSTAPKCTEPNTFPIVFENNKQLHMLSGKATGAFTTEETRFINRWYMAIGRYETMMNNPINKTTFKLWLSSLNKPAENASLFTKASLVDELIDQNIKYKGDKELYQKADHWASPLETIAKGEGDCEDFAILKYYALRYLGVPANKMHVAIVEGPDKRTDRLHAVLVINIESKENSPPRYAVLNSDGAQYMIDAEKWRKGFYLMNEEGAWALKNNIGKKWPALKKTPTTCIKMPKAPKRFNRRIKAKN